MVEIRPLEGQTKVRGKGTGLENEVTVQRRFYTRIWSSRRPFAEKMVLLGGPSIGTQFNNYESPRYNHEGVLQYVPDGTKW